jgi:hypothetical protein
MEIVLNTDVARQQGGERKYVTDGKDDSSRTTGGE